MVTSRVQKAVDRYDEAERLLASGFHDRAVETLHAGAELAVEELAEREGIAWQREDLSPHEARARAAVALRGKGLVPAGFDNLLRRLNEDRKRTKYDGKPTRFDPMTFAQAKASVRLVLDAAGAEMTAAPPPPPPPEPEPPPAPPPAPRRRLSSPAIAAGALVLVAAIAVAAIVGLGGGGDEDKDAPEARGRLVGAGRTGTVAGLRFRVQRVYSGSRIDIGAGRRSRRGLFVATGVDVTNTTDALAPLRLSAFRLRGGSGKVYPVAGRGDQVALAVRPGARAEVDLPFDVPRTELRGSRLVVDDVSRSGRRRKAGVELALPLEESGLGAIKPGRWTGRTSQGERFTMRIDKGGVLRSVVVRVRGNGGRTCPLRLRGVYFIDETGSFGLSSGIVTQGDFSSSTEARGEIRSTPAAECEFPPVRWTARTPLR